VTDLRIGQIGHGLGPHAPLEPRTSHLGYSKMSRSLQNPTAFSAYYSPPVA